LSALQIKKQKPPVSRDKRQSKHYLLQSNMLFRIIGSRHSCPMEIKQAICIFHSAYLCLQHCLAFPFRACGPFFLSFNLTSPLLFVIKPLV